jgi:hypothetical protein
VLQRELESAVIDPALSDEINYWNGFGVDVEWYVHHSGVRAIGVGQGFVWSIEVNAYGATSTLEASLGDWNTGIDV